MIGQIPTYAAGTMYRTGPGGHKVQTKDGSLFETQHWFDGFTNIHRFQIHREGSSCKVYYNSRRTVDTLVEQIRETGKFKEFSFAQKRDPCQGIFKKVMSSFFSSGLGESAGQNIGVALTPNMPGIPATASSSPPGIQTLITRTDNSTYQMLDPETLEPAGVCQQDILHPDLKGPLSATHAKTCPDTGDVFNYNLEVGSKAVYRIFQVSASTGKTSILATFEAPPAYLHTLSITENTVVLCIWNSHYSLRGASLLYHRNILDSISPLDPSEPARWFVIDRSPAKRGILATYRTSAFFCFHTINAYETPSTTNSNKTDIITDLVAYSDLSVLHHLYYSNLVSSSPAASAFQARDSDSFRPNYTRFRLPNVPLSSTASQPSVSAKSSKLQFQQAIIDYTVAKDLSVELPTINPSYHTRTHRYVYGVVDTGLSTFLDGLAKFDTQAQKTKFWRRQGHTAGEPIFVADPQGTAEDDGVLLSVVLDGTEGKSYLLVLDARTMEEAGRAVMDGVVGFGFHGVHVPEGGRVFEGRK